MKNKLFVAGLDWATDSDALRSMFAAFGTVSEANVVTDRETKRSRGFGFVEMSSQAEAELAIKELNGKAVGSSSRELVVKWKEDTPRKDNNRY